MENGYVKNTNSSGDLRVHQSSCARIVVLEIGIQI